MKRAKIYLINDEPAEVRILNENAGAWLNDVMVRGVITDNMYIPLHSISFIVFDEVESEPEPEDEDSLEVEIDKQG